MLLNPLSVISPWSPTDFLKTCVESQKQGSSAPSSKHHHIAWPTIILNFNCITMLKLYEQEKAMY